MNWKIYNISIVATALTIVVGCGSDKINSLDAELTVDKQAEALFPTYDNLVMCGYQGWFNTPGDNMGNGWTHYVKNGGDAFEPGNAKVELWPDVSDYQQKYLTPFVHTDGSGAYLFSSIDYTSTDLHFSWMQEYGIDGVFLQRFSNAVLADGVNKVCRDRVLSNVDIASKKYQRAWSLMYDLSGTAANEFGDVVGDLEEIESQYHLTDPSISPTYLHHRGKPLLALWGVGFSSAQGDFDTYDIRELIADINKNNEYSIMLGVPFYWRELKSDSVTDEDLHALIKECDMIMPWGVGRGDNSTNFETDRLAHVKADVEWCEMYGIDYAPLIYPGSSRGNIDSDPTMYDRRYREGGQFMWNQVGAAYNAGAKSLYIAMFDEIDEGTAIFKTLNFEDVPLNGDGIFIGIENELETDHYLWLTGEITKLMRGELEYTWAAGWAVPQRVSND